MNNYLGREGFFDDTKPTMNEEEFKALNNNDILIFKDKKSFYNEIEKTNYKKSVNLSEIKKLLSIRSYIVGYPTRFKQVYKDNNDWDFVLKKETEYKQELKQWIYDYFYRNNFNCYIIKDWNTR